MTPAPSLSPANYAFLQGYIQRESGISLGEDKLYLLKSRLQPIVEAEKLRSLDDLCDRLRGAPSPALRRSVVEAMTTHETLFFRDPGVFDALRARLIPELAAMRASSKSLRIWSAACSSGQEPYSLAMLLLEAGFSDWNIEILGTDLSTKILERAANGVYPQIEINRGLPAPLLVKYFQRSGLGWLVKSDVRRLVRFTQFDLRNHPRALGQFDLVLCRNVMIYFDTETRKRILAGIRDVLRPGGFLLLGASETTFNLDNTFQRTLVGAATVYQAPLPGKNA